MGARRAQWVAVALVLLGIGGALVAMIAVSPDIHPVAPGSTAPDYKVVSLATGDSVALDAYRGQVVLLNIWATWCGPCEAEMPSIERLYRQMAPQGLKLVSVSIDQADSTKVRRWLEQHELTFPVLQDRSGGIQQLYQTTGVPESFVIDRQGVIVKKVIGATDWDAPPQVALFKRLLAGL